MSSKWAVDDKDPEGHVPTQKEFMSDPLEAGYWVQDALLKAEVASKHGDHEDAIKYYRALRKAVPDKAVAAGLLCNEYEAVGGIPTAIATCAEALTLEGTTIKDTCTTSP